MININSIDIKQYKSIILAIGILQILALLLLLKSTMLSVLCFIIPVLLFILFLFPEFPLAMLLTGNVLLMILFDYYQVEISAPVLIVSTMAIIGGMFSKLFQQAPGKKIVFGKLIYIAFGIGLLLGIGLLFSSNKVYGTRKVIFYFINNMPVILLPLLFRQDLNKVENIINLTYILGLVLGIISTFIAYNLSDNIRFQPSESVNPIWLARSLGTSLICGVYLLSKFKKAMPRFLLILSFFFFIYPILATGSRAPFIGILLSIIIYFLLQPQQPLFRKIKVMIITVGMGVMYFITSSAVVIERIIQPESRDVVSAVFRVIAWLQAGKDFISSPLIGIGTGSFYLDLHFLQFTYPHNLILEIASEIGIIGLFLISYFIILAVNYGMNNVRYGFTIQNKKIIQLSIVVLTIFLYAFWNAQFSGDITGNEIVWLGAGLIWVINTSTSLKTKQYFD